MGFNLGALLGGMFSSGIEANPGFGIKALGDVPFNVSDPEEWMKKHPADEPAVRPSWSKRYFEPDAAHTQEMANFSYKMQPALAEQELAARLKQVEALKNLTDKLDDTRTAYSLKNLPQSAIPKLPYEEKPWDYLVPSSHAPVNMTPEQAVAMKYTGTPVELEAYKNALSNMQEDLGGLRASATGRQLIASLNGGLPEVTANALIDTQRGVSRDEAAKNRDDRIARSVFGEKFKVANDLAKVAVADAGISKLLAGDRVTQTPIARSAQRYKALGDEINNMFVPGFDRHGTLLPLIQSDGTVVAKENLFDNRNAPLKPGGLGVGALGLGLTPETLGLRPATTSPASPGVGAMSELNLPSGLKLNTDAGFRSSVAPEELGLVVSSKKAPPDPIDDIFKLLPQGLKDEAARLKKNKDTEQANKDAKEVLNIQKRLKELENPIRPVFTMADESTEPQYFEPYSTKELKDSHAIRLAEAVKLATRLKELQGN